MPVQESAAQSGIRTDHVPEALRADPVEGALIHVLQVRDVVKVPVVERTAHGNDHGVSCRCLSQAILWFSLLWHR